MYSERYMEEHFTTEALDTVVNQFDVVSQLNSVAHDLALSLEDNPENIRLIHRLGHAVDSITNKDPVIHGLSLEDSMSINYTRTYDYSVEGIGSILRKIWDTIAELWHSFVDFIKTFVVKVIDFIKGLFGKGSSGSGGSTTAVQKDITRREKETKEIEKIVKEASDDQDHSNVSASGTPNFVMGHEFDENGEKTGKYKFYTGSEIKEYLKVKDSLKEKKDQMSDIKAAREKGKQAPDPSPVKTPKVVNLKNKYGNGITISTPVSTEPETVSTNLHHRLGVTQDEIDTPKKLIAEVSRWVKEQDLKLSLAKEYAKVIDDSLNKEIEDLFNKMPREFTNGKDIINLGNIISTILIRTYTTVSTICQQDLTKDYDKLVPVHYKLQLKFETKSNMTRLGAMDKITDSPGSLANIYFTYEDIPEMLKKTGPIGIIDVPPSDIKITVKGISDVVAQKDKHEQTTDIPLIDNDEDLKEALRLATNERLSRSFEALTSQTTRLANGLKTTIERVDRKTSTVIGEISSVFEPGSNTIGRLEILYNKLQDHRVLLRNIKEISEERLPENEFAKYFTSFEFLSEVFTPYKKWSDIPPKLVDKVMSQGTRRERIEFSVEFFNEDFITEEDLPDRSLTEAVEKWKGIDKVFGRVIMLPFNFSKDLITQLTNVRLNYVNKTLQEFERYIAVSNASLNLKHANIVKEVKG